MAQNSDSLKVTHGGKCDDRLHINHTFELHFIFASLNFFNF